MPKLMTHRCAVCWLSFEAHEAWFTHANEEHGAKLAEFGFDRCDEPNKQYRPCPGRDHMSGLRAEGSHVRRPKPEVTEVVTKDGVKFQQERF